MGQGNNGQTLTDCGAITGGGLTDCTGSAGGFYRDPESTDQCRLHQSGIAFQPLNQEDRVAIKCMIHSEMGL